ncbi:replication factor C subunit (activator I) [Legionella lansingensis]|uniref:tRNA-splicing ligase RtcB n=1 Tax=Legionella lansingensis TaxID=45067 RepID=A0A0W0VZI1_9GAMM|nr:RtcB family protein [Legionella lansingensis]KTD25687.1 replication factor C subunit (activator I) [Legionella lansingensis]SNV49154.1 replication factor C subunit (activator I) [Legionella lansingensis]
MDMTQIKQLDEYRWAPKEKQDSVILYGTRELIEAMDEKVREQIINVASLPGLVGHAMTMPDAHWGYGFPIGGVAAFDANQGGIISAGGVGFDISCGIRCLRTNLFHSDILPYLAELAEKLFENVPSGVGSVGKIRLSTAELDDVMSGGALWALDRGYGIHEDLEYIEEKGCIAKASPKDVSEHAKQRQLREMGTLGSGNHYLEIQLVKQIYDKQAAEAFGLVEDQILIAIHCGSRGLGHQIGSDYLISLAKAAQKLNLHLPDRELACAPILSPEGQQYLGAMRAGINCALANRQIIAHLTREAVTSVLPNAQLETLFDVSHNTCKLEKHTVNGKEKEIYIHRKGATRAFGPKHPAVPHRYKEVGQPVCIGGSMGTGSFILAGNSTNDAFASACHGAGRQMSRRQALKHWQGRALVDKLRSEGIYIRSHSMRGIAEEAPGAYKDVHQVVEATELAGLARRVAFLKPLACVKG